MQTQVFTLRQGNKTVGFYNSQKPYIIGFRHSKVARNIMHALHPTPEFTLLRDNPVSLTVPEMVPPTTLTIDSSATLFIPKFSGSSTDPLNDGGFFVETCAYDDFIVYPMTKNVGVILPYVLIDENKNEFTYRAHVIEPCRHSILD